MFKPEIVPSISTKKLIYDKIKQETNDCIQGLTTHGIPNLFRTNHTSARFMWMFLTFGSACVTAIFLTQTILEFLQFNVSTEVRLIDADEMELPIITICNKNKLSTNFSIDFMNKIIEKHSLKSEIMKREYFDLDTKNSVRFELKYDPAKFIFAEIPFELRESMTKSIQDMLIECKFDMKPCNASDFEYIFNAKYGNCYRFNSKRDRYVKKANSQFGLILNLYLGQPSELDNLGLEKGIYVSTDAHNVNPFLDFEDVMEVSTNMETNILLERQLFLKYPKPYSNCDFDNKLKKDDLFTSEYYKLVLASKYSYSRSICLHFCRSLKISQILGCKFRSSSIEIPNINYCTQFNSSDLYDTQDDVVNMNSDVKLEQNIYDNVSKYCHGQCPLECERIKYSNYVSSNEYPDILVDLMKSQIVKKNVFVYETNETKRLENDLVRLKVYYGSMSYIQYKESQIMSIYGLISNLGGSLGLFLGKMN